MKPILIFVLIALFLPTLVFAQEWMPNEKMDDLLIRITQVQKRNPDAERQVQRLLGEWNTDMRSPMAMRELSRLLRQDAPEELLRWQLPLLIKRYGRDRRDRRAESLSSLPVITANNQPLTVEQQAVINQVLEDFQVNENAGVCDQFFPAIAVDSSGNFMVVWEDYRSANSDIYAQCYTSRGVAQGTNFRVNDDSGYSDQVYPGIAVDRGCNFVVVWTDYRNGDSDIYAQRYTSSGVPQGPNFRLNDDSSSLGGAIIAVDGGGNFVLAWIDTRNGDADIYAQRYSSSGVPQGAAFRVNDDSGSKWQRSPAIAIDARGNFVIVWIDTRNRDSDIYAQRYSSSGVPQGPNFRINDDSGSSRQEDPAIAVDGSGNFVVVWIDFRDGDGDVYAQRYTSTGERQGANFQVNDDSGHILQDFAAIAIDGSGNFVVLWAEYRDRDYDIYAQRYTSNGLKQGGNFRVTDDSGTNDQWQPAIGVDAGGNFVVVWLDYRNGDPDIYAQRYMSSSVPQGTNFRVNDDSGSSDQWYPGIAVDRGGNFVVVWMDGRNGVWDIYGQRYSSSGEAQGVNFRVNDDSGDGGQAYPAIDVDGGGNFVVVWEGDRNGDLAIYAQRYTCSGVKQGANFRMNDDSGAGGQTYPVIAIDGSGNFVMVWMMDDPNPNAVFGIYARRYNSSCIAQGNNFQVNDVSGSIDLLSSPSVSLDSSGNFVVVWRDSRNGHSDIYAQRYNSSGEAQGANFRVNDDSGSSKQDCPDIAIDAGGNFAVVWMDGRNGDWDIYAQRYMSSGAKQGMNFRVNDDNGSSWQLCPAIAADGSGNTVVVWEDYRNGDPDIYAQLFDSQGRRIGSNYRVNNESGKKKQMRPDVKLVNGHIYYTWEDTRIEGQGYDIFARVDRFSTSVIPVADRIEGVPVKYVLYPNYPNPFNPATTISFGLPQPAHVQVEIFDVNGRKVKRLVDQACSAGIHSVVWNGTDEADRKVCSGIYICRFSAGEVMLHRKMILAK